MTKKKNDQPGKRISLPKANRARAEKENQQERRQQQEAGRDTKPGGINKDKSRQPGTR